MKRILLMVVMLLMLVVPSSFAAEVSSDKMILEFESNKVWMVKDELCVSGTFTNKRSDLTIMALKEMTMKFIFTREDGSTYEYVASPVKYPLCRIPAGASKKVNLNFGKFNDTWHKWVTNQVYVFTYREGVTW